MTSRALVAALRFGVFGAAAVAIAACAPPPPARAPDALPAEPPEAPVASVSEPAPLPFRMPCAEHDSDECKRGCDDNVTEDCVTLATMIYKGDGLAADQERAKGMFRLACAGGSARGCMRLGDAYHAMGKQETDEVDAYRKACDAGANQGCVVAGRAYLAGVGVGADPAHAAHLFERVCARGNAEACFELGRQYRRGEGVEPSDVKARDLFDKACKLGLDAGCYGGEPGTLPTSPRD